MAIKSTESKSSNLKKVLLGTAAIAGAGALGMTAHATNANADTLYTVKSGDTLSEIAQSQLGDANKFKEIAQENGLNNPDVLSVGQQLRISDNGQVQVANTQSQSTAQASQVQQKQVSYSQPTQQVSTQASQSQQSAPVQHTQTSQAATTPSGSGSVYDQFIAAGGTPEMWNSIVMPESSGNPNAQNGRYSGLFQTDKGTGTAGHSVADQTKWAISYANSRYGGIQQSINFHNANGWW